MKYSKGIFAVIGFLLVVLVLDIMNISYISNIPLYNINFDLWNIIVLLVLYILTYVIIDKRDNVRKKNQEKIAKMLLKDTYKSCEEYISFISSDEFKRICPKRFPGNETMENNTAYSKMQEAPFEHDSVIFSFGKDGIISSSDIYNYINVKNEYSKYFNNIITFYDMDNITESVKYNLQNAIEEANKQLR